MNLTPPIREERDKLKKLLKLLRQLDPLSDGMLSAALSQYLCVRIAGHVEVGVDSLLEATSTSTAVIHACAASHGAMWSRYNRPIMLRLVSFCGLSMQIGRMSLAAVYPIVPASS